MIHGCVCVCARVYVCVCIMYVVPVACPVGLAYSPPPCRIHPPGYCPSTESMSGGTPGTHPPSETTHSSVKHKHILTEHKDMDLNSTHHIETYLQCLCAVHRPLQELNSL